MTFIVFAFCIVFGITGAILGYQRGVKDTEERWSDAVGRADDARLRAARAEEIPHE